MRRDPGSGGSSALIPATTPGVLVVPMRDEHADDVLAIYQAGIDTGDATFETAAPSWENSDHDWVRGRLVQPA